MEKNNKLKLNEEEKKKFENSIKLIKDLFIGA